MPTGHRPLIHSDSTLTMSIGRAGRQRLSDLRGGGDGSSSVLSPVGRRIASIAASHGPDLWWSSLNWLVAILLNLVLATGAWVLLMVVFFKPEDRSLPSGPGWWDKITNFLATGALDAISSGVSAGCSPGGTKAARESRTALENVIGAAPIWARNAFIVMFAAWACGKLSGHDEHTRPSGSSAAHLIISDLSHPVVANLLVGNPSSLGGAADAGWGAIVGLGGGEATRQSSWQQAKNARRMTTRQALASACAKLALWHWSQPVAYFWVLWAYRCELEGTQRLFAAVVATREAAYFINTLLALGLCPAFLLLDPVTSWHEAPTRLHRLLRVGAYVFTPHNYVTLCLANRFDRLGSPIDHRGSVRRRCAGDGGGKWRFFIGMTGFHVVADFASCFALGLLLSQRVATGRTPPTALLIGYAITASGFVLFVAPAVVSSQLLAAADRGSAMALRLLHGVLGGVVLLGLVYLVVGVGLLCARFDLVCSGYTFSFPCNGHGICESGGSRCHCTLGYGPETALADWCRTDELTDEFTCNDDLCKTVDFRCLPVNHACCDGNCESQTAHCAMVGLQQTPCYCGTAPSAHSTHGHGKHHQGTQCAPSYELRVVGKAFDNYPNGYAGVYGRINATCDGAEVYEKPYAFAGEQVPRSSEASSAQARARGSTFQPVHLFRMPSRNASTAHRWAIGRGLLAVDGQPRCEGSTQLRLHFLAPPGCLGSSLDHAHCERGWSHCSLVDGCPSPSTGGNTGLWRPCSHLRLVSIQ
jgi:hypothetical protein